MASTHTVYIKADTGDISRAARIIAKHLTAMADELERRNLSPEERAIHEQHDFGPPDRDGVHHCVCGARWLPARGERA